MGKRLIRVQIRFAAGRPVMVLRAWQVMGSFSVDIVLFCCVVRMGIGWDGRRESEGR